MDWISSACGEQWSTNDILNILLDRNERLLIVSVWHGPYIASDILPRHHHTPIHGIIDIAIFRYIGTSLEQHCVTACVAARPPAWQLDRRLGSVIASWWDRRPPPVQAEIATDPTDWLTSLDWPSDHTQPCRYWCRGPWSEARMRTARDYQHRPTLIKRR